MTAPAGHPHSPRWSAIPILLVIVMLLGSVLIPARQSLRIMQLLREATDVIEPARLMAARLEFGLGVESAALEGYALSGDSLQLARFRTTAADDDHRLAVLERVAASLDAEGIDRAASVRVRVGEWRTLSRALADGSLPRSQLGAQLRTRQATYQSALRDVSRLATYLAAEESARRDVIRGSEWFGLVVNASLVFVALAAVLGVGALSRRERRLTTTLQRRIEEEAALRHVARSLGAARTIEEVVRLVVEGAAATTHATGAYAECVVTDDGAVESVLQAPGGTPVRSRRPARAASLSESVMTRGGAGSLTEMDSVPDWLLEMTPPGVPLAGIVAPLTSPDRSFGALLLLRGRTAAPFGEDARRQLHTLADLASAAMQRVTMQEAERRALEEARLRASQEAALREAAEALAAAFTVEEVTRQIARTALEATRARGAFVERVERVERVDVEGNEREGVVVVRASVGEGVPGLQTTAPYAGSYAELVLTDGEPILIPDLAHAKRPYAAAASAEASGSAIVVPLGTAGAPIGALFVLSASRTPFGADDLTRAHAFGDLAALAYEKVRLLDEAREGRCRLERIMTSRSRLMRGFSHDVKNPLNAADGYAELLTAGIYGELSSEQAESVERLRRSIHGALALLDDLHELARAETGQLELTLRPTDLGVVVHACGEEYRAAAEASGLSLELASTPLVVDTDPSRVRQIIGNLLSNAIKYTARGSVALRVGRRVPDGADPSLEWAIIDVQDTGRGIPADKRDAIFEEFFRVGDHEMPGAGLGLSISRRLAQALGGRITVVSEVGCGSTFSLWLPRERKPEDPRVDAPPADRDGDAQSRTGGGAGVGRVAP